MKNECQRTRQELPKYLRGHLFKTSQKRISRHLQKCVVCRSEFEALKRVEETRLLLQDINATDDIIGRVREGVSLLGRLKKVLYRPLWVAGILLIAVGVYYYIVTPRQLDIEIERIVKTAPSATRVEPAIATGTGVTTSSAPTKSAQPPAAAAPAAVMTVPAPDSLAVSITPINDREAVQRINEVMRSHGSLRTMSFSEMQKEISGSLTAKELMTFFSRIETVAKVSFNRKRFESFSAEQPIPFIMKLKPAPKHAEAPAAASPAPQPAAQPPVPPSAHPAPHTAPPQPETAPSSSAVQ
jgi:hypothetical protein